MKDLWFSDVVGDVSYDQFISCRAAKGHLIGSPSLAEGSPRTLARVLRKYTIHCSSFWIHNLYYLRSRLSSVVARYASPPYGLSWLELVSSFVDHLTLKGVKFVKGWVGSVADVEYIPGSESKVKTDVVVNASGLGKQAQTRVSNRLLTRNGVEKAQNPLSGLRMP